MLQLDRMYGRNVTDAVCNKEPNFNGLVKTSSPKVGPTAGEPVTCLYETLEVSPRASNFVIRAAYQTLVQQHQQDQNHDIWAAGRRLAGINDAYAVLSDVAKRLGYDRKLAVIERTRTAWRCAS